ncbi:hypothetical protein COCOBI_09-2700 [Coccomyxa sp. Obi]|nr:hypothetical protein COCOBI_09-2700 [Coccomyxa sp. Obi]
MLVLLSVLCHNTKATAGQGAVQGRKLLVCNAAAIRQCPKCCESVPSGQSLVGTVTSTSYGTTKQTKVKSNTKGGTTGTGTTSALPMEMVQSESQTRTSLVDSSSLGGTFTTTVSG